MTQYAILMRIDDGDFRDRSVKRRGYECLFSLSNWGVLHHVTEDKAVADAYAFKDDGYTQSREYDVYNMDNEADVHALQNREIDFTILGQGTGDIANRLTGVKNIIYLKSLLATAQAISNKRPDVIMFIDGTIATLEKEEKYDAQDEVNRNLQERIAALEEKVGIEPPVKAAEPDEPDEPDAPEGDESDVPADEPADETTDDQGDTTGDTTPPQE